MKNDNNKNIIVIRIVRNGKSTLINAIILYLL